SASAAAAISSSVIGASGPGAGIGSSVPSGSTRRKVPSGCILTEVSVLLMSLRPPGRDDPDIVAAFGFGHAHPLPLVLAEQPDGLGINLEGVHYAGQHAEISGGGGQLDEPLRPVPLLQTIEHALVHTIVAHELAGIGDDVAFVLAERGDVALRAQDIDRRLRHL